MGDRLVQRNPIGLWGGHRVDRWHRPKVLTWKALGAIEWGSSNKVRWNYGCLGLGTLSSLLSL
jgi:hypothetical protein